MFVDGEGGFDLRGFGGEAVKALKRCVMGMGVAVLCLAAALAVVTTAGAGNGPAPNAAVGCGTLNLSSGGLGTHVSATAALGQVSARLEGTVADVWSMRGLGSPRLAIRDGRMTLRSGPVDVLAGWEGPPAAIVPEDIVFRPEPSPGGQDPVVPICVARFAAGDRPVVLMGLYTGGAHCCTVLRAYPAERKASGAGIELQIGNPGVDVRADGDHAMVVTADDAFNYEFNAFAFSGVSIRLLTFHKGGFADITRSRPDLIRADAGRWWKGFNDDPPQGLGLLAAWVADQCLLDNGRSAWATVDQLLAQGKLAGPPDNGGLWPAGADYVAKLHTFLPEHGYCR
jgi:hypothetical protein